jgi:hypothetical protein
MLRGIQIQANSNDTITIPSYTWQGASNTGMYHANTNTIGFTCAGSNILSLSPTACLINGTNAIIPVANPIVILKHRLTSSASNYPAQTWTNRAYDIYSGYNTLSALSNTTFTNGQFTLLSGTFHIRADAINYNANGAALRIFNVTDNSEVAVGCPVINRMGQSNQIVCSVEEVFTVASSKTFAIQTWVESEPSPLGSIGTMPNLYPSTVILSTAVIRRLA